jgi:hypothetical protein
MSDVNVCSWDWMIEDCSQIDEFSELQKKNAVTAFGFLREEFGEDFLLRVVESGHPLAASIHNVAPWTRLWFADLGDSLALLKNSPGFEILKSKIVDPDHCSEGISILAIARRLAQVSFDIALEVFTPGGKRPDIRCTNVKTGEVIYVEVCQMDPGTDRGESSRQYDELRRTLFAAYPGIEHVGALYKRLSPAHLGDVVGGLRNLIQRVDKERRLFTFCLDGAYDFALAPKSEIDHLKLWAADRGLHVGLRGFPASVDELRRLKRTIHQEQGQCPTDSPGVVIVYDDHLWLDAENWLSAADEVEETVYSHPQLAVVGIVTSRVTASSPDDINGSHRLNRLVSLEDHPAWRRGILLFNRFGEVPVTTMTLSMLYQALSR